MRKIPIKLKLYQILERLGVEEAKQLDYSIKYARNVQAKFHRKNPNKRIRIYKDGRKVFAGRES